MGIHYKCDYCAEEAEEKPCHYKLKKRHFCCQRCYSLFRMHRLPKEEQHAYKGGGLPDEERRKRIKARADLNHAVRDGKIKRGVCEACGGLNSEAHHGDYLKALDVHWLCRRCHWDEHKLIFEKHKLLSSSTKT